MLATLDPVRTPPLARELALLELEADDGILEPGERWVDRWDPRDDLQDEVDLGWIGEDREGIWLHRHPEAAMVEDDALWWVVAEWQLGHRELSAEDRSGHKEKEGWRHSRGGPSGRLSAWFPRDTTSHSRR